MISGFVLYEVCGVIKQNGSDTDTHIKVSGVVRDQPEKLSWIFRQNPELLPCDSITKEYYERI